MTPDLPQTASYCNAKWVRCVTLLVALVGTSCNVGQKTANSYWVNSILGGVADGLTLVLSTLGNLVLHPVSTVRGLQLALQHWERSQEFLILEWDHYRSAFSSDTAEFVNISLSVALYVAASVLLAQSLEALADLLSHRRFSGVTVSLRSAIRRHGLVHRVYVLLRVRNIQLESRLASRGTGIRARFRRLQWAFADVGRAFRSATLYPLAWLLFLLCRIVDNVWRYTKVSLRYLWRQTAYLLLPTILIFQLWIDWSVDFDKSATEARQRLTPAAESYFAEVAVFEVAELRENTEALQSIYEDFRYRLLEPINELDAILDSELLVLNELLTAKIIQDPVVIDLKVAAMFERFSTRKVFLTELIFALPPATEGGWTSLSRNWLQSYLDEQTLLREAAALVQGPETKAYLASVIDVLDRRLAFEGCIAQYYVAELLERPLPERHEYCGTLDAPNSVEEMRRRMFAPDGTHP